MKNNLEKRIILKMLIQFTISCAIMLIILFWIYFSFKVLLQSGNSLAWTIFNILDDKIGIHTCYTILGLIISLGFFLLLNYKKIRYFVQINQIVWEIADGNFTQRIPVQSKEGQLGELASGINRIVDKLKHAQELELQAEQSKSELFTNVSHDLRTPLTSIIGYLRLIGQDRYKDEVELRYYTDIAYEKSRRLERMVNDLFEYTQMSYGKNILNRTVIDMHALIGQLVADFTFQLSEAGMEIRLSNQTGKAVILADGEKMMRALENLISNAMKYSKSGKYIDVSVTQRADQVIVQLKNYGPKIPASDLPHIFERFYRAEKSRSEQTGGSGLGLAIVKSIIEAHEGSITVSSCVQETVFEIRLPLNRFN
ncbi:sensor histidine kinase [Paenibacillus aestuarii]|uniref:histidine kinase n=1 Tax=Paenibacillus aestuarii TaxID=516965 RepID=A0ABW0K948_9BACL|nr:ATP-binding protein [Paenibacillus aestuarii]